MLKIPLDVERLCVEAVISDFVYNRPTSPTKLPTVLWVCRRFKAWCYPHLYRSIALSAADNDTSVGVSLLRRTLAECPELALLVQELTLPHHSAVSDVEEIVPLCRNLISLLVWNNKPSVDLSNHKALRRLSCFPILFPSALESPLPPTFVHLTHLDIIISEGSTWYPQLSRLTKLTHLSTDLPSVH